MTSTGVAPTMSKIPSSREIEAINRGEVRGNSAYHNTRHEVWSAIRARYEELVPIDPDELDEMVANADRYPRLAEDEEVIARELGDAIEWAVALDSHIPSQYGSTEMAYFRDQALAAL